MSFQLGILLGFAIAYAWAYTLREGLHRWAHERGWFPSDCTACSTYHDAEDLRKQVERLTLERDAARGLVRDLMAGRPEQRTVGADCRGGLCAVIGGLEEGAVSYTDPMLRERGEMAGE